MIRCTFRTHQRVFLLVASTLSLSAFAQTLPPAWPGDTWEVKTPAELGMDPAKLTEAQNYALSRNGSGLIVRNGYQVAAWGIATDRYPVSSLTKSVGALLLGIANRQGLVGLADRAQTHLADFGIVPVENQETGWLDDVTIEQLATHSSGFEKDRLAPRLKFEPAKQWVYSDGGANWLADILTVKLGDDLATVLGREVLTPLGATLRPAGGAGDLEWRAMDPANPRGTHIGGIPRREFNAGISINVDAMARIGLLLARDGTWNGTQILTPEFIDRLSTPASSIQGLPVTDTGGATDPNYPNAPAHLGVYWWNNADGTLPDVPRDAFWGWGLGDHLIVVIPSLELVIARTSSLAATGADRLKPFAWKDGVCQTQMCAHYDALEPFLKPIVQSVQASSPPPTPAPTPTPEPPGNGGGGGGGGVLQWWLLATLLLAGGTGQTRRSLRRIR
jgi:CubicO group peptidase (beta-lactamase class C family)